MQQHHLEKKTLDATTSSTLSWTSLSTTLTSLFVSSISDINNIICSQIIKIYVEEVSIWLVEYHEISSLESSILTTSSSNKLRPFKCFIFLCSWLVSLQSPTKRQFWFLEWLMIYCGGVGTNLQLWPDLPNQASGQGQNSDRSGFWCYRPPPMIDARHQRLVKSCLKAINLYLVGQA